MTNEDGWLKRGFNTDLNRPLFAIMKPGADLHRLPLPDRACGITDIIIHGTALCCDFFRRGLRGFIS